MAPGSLKSAATAVSIARAAFGVAMVAAPQRIAQAWIGDDGLSVRVGVLARSIGARDIALGGGATLALLRGNRDAARAWLVGQCLSDLVDLAGTLAVRDRLPARGVAQTAALAGASAAIAAAAAVALD